MSAVNKNRSFEFDNYIVSSCNEEAYNACLSVANGDTGRIIALHGPSSCGKTHLITALKNTCSTAYPDKNIRMVSYNDIISEYIEALSADHADRFYDMIREYDILIIDNLQFAAGKSSTQQELAEWFSAMIDLGRCVVMAFDRPAEIFGELLGELRAKHRDRVLVIEMKDPDRPLRENYLDRLLAEHSCTLPDGMYERIIVSENVPLSSFRGLVSGVHFISEQKAGNVTEDEIGRCFDDYLGKAR